MQRLLLNISFCSTFFPALLSIVKFRRQPKDLKILSVFFCFTLIVEVTMYFIVQQEFNSNWLINIFALIEGIFLIYVLSLWSTGARVRNVILGAGVVYFFFWLTTTFRDDSLMVFNDYEKVLKGIILISASCYILINYGLENSQGIYRDYKFWMLAGILFYFTLTLVVFATSKMILANDVDALRLTWPIHSVVNIFANTIFSIGYICFLRKTNSSLS